MPKICAKLFFTPNTYRCSDVCNIHWHQQTQMSRDMKFRTMWQVRPAKAPTSLRIGAVLSEPVFVT